MRRLIFLFIICTWFGPTSAQELYFPPINGDAWETMDPSALGWCQENIDSLYHFLEQKDAKAILVLKDGKIVLEKYFGTFQQDSLWYWASAGKSLTACLVGIAQQEGWLNIKDTSSQYLGEGWTSCLPEQEEKITVRHQLTMTSGLDDGVDDSDCTLDTCLEFKADAGSRWAYHNAPYTLLDQVVESATGLSINSFFLEKVRPATGINGIYLPLGYNNVFFSTARSMARFGLWMLNKGEWDGTPILTDTSYIHQMTNTSQSLNPSYGYLWWLNGKSSYKIPGLQFDFQGSLIPDAPDDMIMALGRNGQFVNIVPSQNLVLIRMGNAPDGSELAFWHNIEIWQYVNKLECQTATENHHNQSGTEINIIPNPAATQFEIRLPVENANMWIYSIEGTCVYKSIHCSKSMFIQPTWPAGIYFVVASDGNGQRWIKKMSLTGR